MQTTPLRSSKQQAMENGRKLFFLSLPDVIDGHRKKLQSPFYQSQCELNEQPLRGARDRSFTIVLSRSFFCDHSFTIVLL
jgi:hypothetical protein